MLSESKYLADFLVGFLGKKPQTLLIPIYSTTVLYDINLRSNFLYAAARPFSSLGFVYWT